MTEKSGALTITFLFTRLRWHIGVRQDELPSLDTTILHTLSISATNTTSYQGSFVYRTVKDWTYDLPLNFHI